MTTKLHTDMVQPRIISHPDKTGVTRKLRFAKKFVPDAHSKWQIRHQFVTLLRAARIGADESFGVKKVL